jgi:5-methylcytosine-specific restriction endonuclease McrA
VYERDNWQCAACGISVASGWKSVQHRVARGVSGSNELQNLVLLCGSATTGCHLKCEQRDAEMHRRGFWLPSWENPAVVPVIRYDGLSVMLAADGSYSLAEGDHA